RAARRLHQGRDDRRTGNAYIRTAAADRSPAMAERYVYAAAILRHAQRMDAAIWRAAGEAAHLYACRLCAAAARARTSLWPTRRRVDRKPYPEAARHEPDVSPRARAGPSRRHGSGAVEACGAGLLRSGHGDWRTRNPAELFRFPRD